MRNWDIRISEFFSDVEASVRIFFHILGECRDYYFCVLCIHLVLGFSVNGELFGERGKCFNRKCTTMLRL